MLGVIDHDLTTLSLPFLDVDNIVPGATQDNQRLGDATPHVDYDARVLHKTVHDTFDDDIFTGDKPKSKDEIASKVLHSPGLYTPRSIASPKTCDGKESTAAPTPQRAAHLGVDKSPTVTRKREMSITSQAPTIEPPVALLKDLKALPTQSDLKRPESPISVTTGFNTPRAAKSFSRQVSINGGEVGSLSEAPNSAAKSLRSLRAKPNPSPFSTITHFFKSFTQRPHTHHDSGPDDVAITLSDNTTNGQLPEITVAQPAKSAEEPVHAVSQLNQASLSKPTPIKKRPDLEQAAWHLGNSQVEPVAIPARGKQMSKRITGRRASEIDLSTSLDKNDRTASTRPRARQRTVTRPPASYEAPHQVAFSYPSMRGGLSVPYGSSYKRSYMSSINPCRPGNLHIEKASKARRWQHALPRPTFTQNVKWDSICAPACLPLTTDIIPKEDELKSQFHEQVYVFDCQANQLSFLLRPPSSGKHWDLPIEVLREMASQRLSRKSVCLCRRGSDWTCLTHPSNRKLSIHRMWSENDIRLDESTRECCWGTRRRCL